MLDCGRPLKVGQRRYLFLPTPGFICLAPVFDGIRLKSEGEPIDRTLEIERTGMTDL